mmetsp:Transcript_8284/g.15966  ORF Transcript_8284/g.15966 Transcript_8284/m.15966 type:complete len:613 (-) Transcript_8284:209-2047(-)|eukprot:CAMPEP_0175056292 /NCGR_PEP_ID=MMETSP0052_2-20121109/10584_1 /TAXON_ID=51329 ORGANISM="Polytomella parva, Strain SAG 63-3" /NCGR_SAMPLE_ID=MMETSP0052_2 /ASSEMBLY_ACC=CAM_ASM_000194 /LENGTH=612 /DNA_ID=CAMNT_0016321291 /DNA_START=203 /DNA_END=2041 /DNA_ORIENTATION=-
MPPTHFSENLPPDTDVPVFCACEPNEPIYDLKLQIREEKADKVTRTFFSFAKVISYKISASVAGAFSNHPSLKVSNDDSKNSSSNATINSTFKTSESPPSCTPYLTTGTRNWRRLTAILLFMQQRKLDPERVYIKEINGLGLRTKDEKEGEGGKGGTDARYEGDREGKWRRKGRKEAAGDTRDIYDGVYIEDNTDDDEICYVNNNEMYKIQDDLETEDFCVILIQKAEREDAITCRLCHDQRSIMNSISSSDASPCKRNKDNSNNSSENNSGDVINCRNSISVNESVIKLIKNDDVFAKLEANNVSADSLGINMTDKINRHSRNNNDAIDENPGSISSIGDISLASEFNRTSACCGIDVTVTNRDNSNSDNNMNCIKDSESNEVEGKLIRINPVFKGSEVAMDCGVVQSKDATMEKAEDTFGDVVEGEKNCTETLIERVTDPGKMEEHNAREGNGETRHDGETMNFSEASIKEKHREAGGLRKVLNEVLPSISFTTDDGLVNFFNYPIFDSGANAVLPPSSPLPPLNSSYNQGLQAPPPPPSSHSSSADNILFSEKIFLEDSPLATLEKMIELLAIKSFNSATTFFSASSTVGSKGGSSKGNPSFSESQRKN